MCQPVFPSSHEISTSANVQCVGEEWDVALPSVTHQSSKRTKIGLETCRFGSSAAAPCTHLNVTQPSEEKVISPCVTPLTVCSVLFLLQPPPLITDKQLDEREHTVEEWKGTVEKAKPFCLPMLWCIHWALLNVCTMLHYNRTLLYEESTSHDILVGHLILIFECYAGFPLCVCVCLS